ncbi:MAG: GntR family transcriptional regulator [Hyphomicrobiaceae bacterium]|nr:MAG: GntR family transcriptional regulator [Hyphomicrobiaceae bacterium]
MDPNSAAAVADRLREDIRLGRLRSGTVLRQDAIAVRFGVSRQPVRLALRDLRACGLVTVRRDRSVEIAGLSRDAAGELAEVRLLVEREALRLAIARRGDRDILEAKHLQERIEIETEPDRIAELDCAFHAVLYKPGGNARLLKLVEDLRLENRRPYQEQPVGSLQRALLAKQHRKIVRTYAAGDGDGAVRALEEHLRSTLESKP